MGTHELLFCWYYDDGKKNINRQHILHSTKIPRIGETVDLGYLGEYSQYIERRVTDVRYVYNANYVFIELGDE